MTHLNILQQGPCCVGNGHQEGCIEAIGKNFQGIYRDSKTRGKRVQSNLGVSALGRHLDCGVWDKQCELYTLYPENSSLFLVAVHLPSTVCVLTDRIKEFMFYQIFQIHEYTGPHQGMYRGLPSPADPFWPWLLNKSPHLRHCDEEVQPLTLSSRNPGTEKLPNCLTLCLADGIKEFVFNIFSICMHARNPTEVSGRE
jgi:hypothetical protein